MFPLPFCLFPPIFSTSFPGKCPPLAGSAPLQRRARRRRARHARCAGARRGQPQQRKHCSDACGARSGGRGESAAAWIQIDGKRMGLYGILMGF